MNAASAMASELAEAFNSDLSCPVQSMLTQKEDRQLMHYPADPSQIGSQITQIVLNSTDSETLLPRIADALGEIFQQIDACVITTVTSNHSIIQTAYWCDRNYPARISVTENLLTKHPVVETILNNSEPIEINEVDTSQIWDSLEWQSQVLSIKAGIAISTKLQGEVNGMILLGRSQPSAWSDSEKQLLKVVSEQVAIAMSQIQLQHQVRTAAQYQTLLNQLTSAIRSAWDLDQILQLSIQGTAQTLKADRGLILLLKYADPRFKTISGQVFPKAKVAVVCEWYNNEIKPQVEHSLAPASINGDTQPLPPPRLNLAPSLLNQTFWLSECNLCQQALVNAPQPLLINDKQDLESIDSQGGIKSVLYSESIPAILMVPLENQGTVLGFLVLQHSYPRSWQPEELVLTNWVSAQISTAIIHNQTLRQVQALVDERTAQLQRSLEVQAKLYEKTRQQIDQLRYLNQLKDEFIDTVNHELQTPLATMKLAICNLRRQPEPPADRRAKYLEILEQQCTQEINLIKDLLALQKLESHQLPINLEKIDLKPIISDLAQSFNEKWADKGLNLEVSLPERSLMLQSDAESLNRILLELLTNAGKYSEPESTVRIEVSHQINQQANQILLTISNVGHGITPTELTYIFDKFRRGQGVTQQAIQGTGLGLALVKSLVEHLTGTITVSSSPIENSQSCEIAFNITLPQFFDSGKL